MKTTDPVVNIRGDITAWDLVEHYLTPIRPLLELDDISEIMINRFDEIYIERRGEMIREERAFFASENALLTAIIQIGTALAQPVDPRKRPILDARLPDGSRVCGVLYPTSTRGCCMSIRVFPKQRLTAAALVERGSVTQQMFDFLRVAMLVKSNILVSGGTSSGKTTLLNALSSFIPREERVITVEDTQELQLDLPHRICLEAPRRDRDDDSALDIDLAYLLLTTLRLNPSRVFVGEVRDLQAAIALLHAINTGHDGCCSTIHANNAADALTRMQVLIAGGSGGALPFQVVRAQVRANLNLLIHAEATPKHGRRVVQIAELRRRKLQTLWSWDYVQGAHVEHSENLQRSEILERAKRHGINHTSSAH